MAFDTREFRNALGSFPTGVAVVTAEGIAAPLGITVNSFSSVSLDPPLVLWCLDKMSDRFGAFTSARHYVISILGAQHSEISSRLARQGQHRLDGVDTVPTSVGLPALADAIAVFECEKHAAHDAGDHVILVGRVVNFFRQEAGVPLVFFRGKYGALAQK
jgi:4-hydroxyphenylacetate 3-hydroxylase, reductase component